MDGLSVDEIVYGNPLKIPQKDFGKVLGATPRQQNIVESTRSRADQMSKQSDAFKVSSVSFTKKKTAQKIKFIPESRTASPDKKHAKAKDLPLTSQKIHHHHHHARDHPTPQHNSPKVSQRKEFKIERSKKLLEYFKAFASSDRLTK